MHLMRLPVGTSRFTRGHFELERQAQGDKMNDAIDVVLIAAIKEEYDAARSVFSATAVSSDGVVSWDDNTSLPSAPYDSNGNARPSFLPLPLLIFGPLPPRIGFRADAAGGVCDRQRCAAGAPGRIG